MQLCLDIICRLPCALVTSLARACPCKCLWLTNNGGSCRFAAEEGSPDEVWEAVKLLKCARLDHGVRAMEDPACIAFLEDTQVPLTVCPRSNYMVRAPPSTTCRRNATRHLGCNRAL